jgi:hypothetical protein
MNHKKQADHERSGREVVRDESSINQLRAVRLPTVAVRLFGAATFLCLEPTDGIVGGSALDRVESGGGVGERSMTLACGLAGAA